MPAGNVNALSEAMRNCLNAPLDMLTPMGDAARERVLAWHDVDTEAAKLGALFRALAFGRACEPFPGEIWAHSNLGRNP